MVFNHFELALTIHDWVERMENYYSDISTMVIWGASPGEAHFLYSFKFGSWWLRRGDDGKALAKEGTEKPVADGKI